MPNSTLGEVRELVRFVREIRAYNRDRIGYIQARRLVDGRNFYVGDQTLVVTDGATAKRLLTETNNAIFTPPVVAAKGDQSTALASRAQTWMPARKAASRHLKMKQVVTYAQRISEIAERRLSIIEGETVDLMSLFSRVSGDVMCELLLGDDSGGFPELVELAAGATARIIDGSGRWPSWVPLPAVRTQQRADTEMRERLRAVIEKRTREDGRRDRTKDLMQDLLQEDDLTEDQVIDALQLSLLASFNAPGAAMAWTLLALKGDEELEHNARAEAGRIGRIGNIGNIGAGGNLLQMAPLLAAVVSESLRIHPPAWMVGRVCIAPIDLENLHIEPGTTVDFAIYSIHRGEDWYQPHNFLPDRWLHPERYRKGTYLPFASGPRVCLGSHLGMIEVLATMHAFLRTFEIDAMEIDATPVPGALLTPRRFTGKIRRRTPTP